MQNMAFGITMNTETFARIVRTIWHYMYMYILETADRAHTFTFIPLHQGM